MAKQSAVALEKQRIVHCMERFDCHGRLHITLCNGVAVVEIIHHQSHKPYVCIDLLERWRKHIEKHHKLGPARVCRQHEGLLIQ